MGFDNALIACMEEPDEVKDLLNFLLELNLELGKKTIQYYQLDMYHMGDDIAHERAPFVSEAVFLDIFEPMWRQNTAIYKEAGLPAEHHNCGAFEAFVPYIVDMGFNAWNPAQPTFNNLPAIKEKYLGRLAICGGFESNGSVSLPETTEEQVRAYVREVMDTLAPGGSFAFSGNILGNQQDPFIQERNGWIWDEYEKNKYNYYK
jgi:uroporphyrinogen-III decarboxylase